MTPKEKLASSGLDPNDAKNLCISGISANEAQSLGFKPLPSLKIEYHGPDGQPMQDWPKSPPFFRLRYLEEPVKGFSDAGSKAQRYAQPPNTAPVVYYPQNMEGWQKVCEDVTEPLIITEGELKAAKACKEGFPTIGLGGVYSWRSKKLGITWLKSLDLIKWEKRRVYLCFDSDYRDNQNVCKGLRDLAEEIERHGSFVYLISLPELPGLDKVGLDDFLVHAGHNANELFEDLLQNAEPLGLSRPLWEFNDKYVYIRNPGLIISQNDLDHRITASAFKDHLESTSKYLARKIFNNGETKLVAESAAGAWLSWPLRLEADKLTYLPGKGRFVERQFNTWSGWGCVPKKGSVRPFLQLVDHVFTGAEPEAKKWFLRWCAYPIQNPGVKLFSSCVVHGIKQGTGKSLIGYSIGRVYGKNFTEIKQKHLHKDFNQWAVNKQFIMGDEITGSDKRVDADMLKGLITQEEIWIDVKFVPEHSMPDVINYYFSSQHPDSFFLEDDDRRFFVHEVIVPPLKDKFYTDYKIWLKEKGGDSAIFYYLLHLDLGDFNPAAHAYYTAAKDRMIETGRSDLASWVRDLIHNPDNVTKVGTITVKKDLYTSAELLNYYDPEGIRRVTANGLSRELKRAGARQVRDGSPIRLTNGTSFRYFVIRNHEHWFSKKADPKKYLESLETKAKF